MRDHKKSKKLERSSVRNATILITDRGCGPEDVAMTEDLFPVPP